MSLVLGQLAKLESIFNRQLTEMGEEEDKTGTGQGRMETARSSAGSRAQKQIQALDSASLSVTSLGNLDGDGNSFKSGLETKKQTLESSLLAKRNAIHSLQENQLAKANKAKEMKGYLMTEEAKLQAQRDDLEWYVSRCESQLGLKVQPTTRGTYILQMDQLDPEHKDRRFSCELQTSYGEGEKPFAVLKCNPAIPDIRALEDLLIQTRDLSGFVVSLRKKFKATL